MPTSDIDRVDQVIQEVQGMIIPPGPFPGIQPPASELSLADHVSDVVQRVSTEVARHLSRIRRQLDELDKAVIASAGATEQALRDHMRVSAHAVSTGDLIERELVELRGMLERVRT